MQFTAKEKDRISKGLPPWDSMSFACGGWLQFYMFGVSKALQEAKLDHDVTYLGCSAGTLSAVGLVLKGNFDNAIDYCNEMVLPNTYNRFTGLFRLSEYITSCLELYLMDNFDSIPLPKGKLQIAVTRLPFLTPERVVTHESKDELMKSILASCAAFPFTPIVYRNNSWYIDGGLTDFQPIIDDDTITVSPFYFCDCDIKPSRYVPVWWSFFPPKDKATVEWLYKLGWEDCMAYIKSRDIPIDHLAQTQGRASHPYDTPRKISMHRFLGYDLQNMTHQYLAFFLDLVLLCLLLILLKPLALLLIYLELWIHIFILSIIYFIKVLSDRMLLSLYNVHVSMLFNNISSSSTSTTTSSTTSTARRSFQGVEEYIPQRGKAWLRKQNNDLWDCITCVFSLSLLLRFISGRPSVVKLRKDDRLTRLSLLYRIFRHMI